MKKIIFYITIVVMAAAACTEDLDVDYLGDANGTLVVDGKITTDTIAHTVYLHRTIDYRSEELPPETGAIITISNGVQTFGLTETEPGKYQTDSTVFGVPNSLYRLHIELTNGEIYEAEDYMHPIGTIDSITVKKEKEIYMEDTTYLVYFYGQEEPTPDQFYRWDLYLNDTLWTDTLKNVTFASDENVNGNYVLDFDVFWLEENDFKTDTVEVTMEMASISETYYNFIEAAMLETEWRGGMFDATPANIPTNIEGAFGFFRASAVTRKSIIYIVSPNADNN